MKFRTYLFVGQKFSIEQNRIRGTIHMCLQHRIIRTLEVPKKKCKSSRYNYTWLCYKKKI